MVRRRGIKSSLKRIVIRIISYVFLKIEKLEDRKKKFILARTFEFFINQVYQVYYGL